MLIILFITLTEILAERFNLQKLDITFAAILVKIRDEYPFDVFSMLQYVFESKHVC